MNDFRLSPDDPKLTAYALGELHGEEFLAVEAALRTDPEARRIVEEIRATAGHLQAALGSEPSTEPESAALSPVASHRVDPYRREASGWAAILRFPQFYYVIGGMAAAGFALMVWWQRPEYEARHRMDPVYAQLARERRARAISEARNKMLRERLALYEAQFGATAMAAPADVAVSPPLAVSPAAVATDPAPTGGLLPAASAPLLAQAMTARPDSQPIVSGGAGASMAAVGNNPASGVTPGPAKGNDVLAWSPFTVPTDADVGFVGAGSSLAGSRLSNLSPLLTPVERLDLYARKGSFTPRSLDAIPPGLQVPEMLRQLARHERNTEAYTYQSDNDFLGVIQNPYSAFSIDVDTASYSNVRRFLQNGRLPPVDAVRIEELMNYFPYRYPAPKDQAGAPPFAASLEVADAPWAPSHRLVRIGLKGREVTTESRPAANLVFLVDVSGSMNAENKLPLVKESMRLLVGKLRGDDRVAIVTYAGQSGLALPSTPVANAKEILAALEALAPDGSTNGAMGIQLAYDIAKANFAVDGVNRVILCTDGDFNVGLTDNGALARLVEEKARSGVDLTVLGFGMGNYKDATLEMLAGKGNGNYGYIDTRREAEKMLVEQVNGTLVTIARDVKIQVEFNPIKVASYRLIGYENRMLKKEDFNDDRIDAGDIGAGHTVTALYEIVPTGSEDDPVDRSSEIDDLRYQLRPADQKLPAAVAKELLTVKMRYKEPSAGESKRLEFPLTDAGLSFSAASADFKFAAAVAQFGMMLRNSPHRGVGTINDVIEWATAGAVDDPEAFRHEFLDLVRRAQELLK